METSTITWIDIKDKRPLKSGWYMVVLMPRNYDEFSKNPTEMNGWIEKFGINKLWWNNNAFWEEHIDVTERITHWGLIPSVPVFK